MARSPIVKPVPSYKNDSMKPSNVLLLPGWQNSGPQHWQSLWEQRYGYVRVDQHDWERPLRGDWITRLEEVLLTRDEPAVLVAHSLGCSLVAAWAAWRLMGASRNQLRHAEHGDENEPAGTVET